MGPSLYASIGYGFTLDPLDIVLAFGDRSTREDLGSREEGNQGEEQVERGGRLRRRRVGVDPDLSDPGWFVVSTSGYTPRDAAEIHILTKINQDSEYEDRHESLFTETMRDHLDFQLNVETWEDHVTMYSLRERPHPILFRAFSRLQQTLTNICERIGLNHEIHCRGSKGRLTIFVSENKPRSDPDMCYAPGVSGLVDFQLPSESLHSKFRSLQGDFPIAIELRLLLPWFGS